MPKRTKYNVAESKIQSRNLWRQVERRGAGGGGGGKGWSHAHRYTDAHCSPPSSDRSLWTWVWLSRQVDHGPAPDQSKWKLFFDWHGCHLSKYNLLPLAFYFLSLKNYFGHNNLPVQMILSTHLFKNQAPHLPIQNAVFRPLFPDWIWKQENNSWQWCNHYFPVSPA